MQNADVLITGISGFIAGHLARTIAATGETVIGIGRREPSAETRKVGVRFVPCDITDAARVREVVAAIRPRTVYHLAAHSVLTGSTAVEMLRVNVTGTTNVLEACRDTGVAVCVVGSSDKQYGALAVPPYDDTDATAFQNGGVYELSKAQADQTARLFAGLYDTPAVRVARFVNIYGGGDTQWTRIIPGTIRRCLRGEPARITAGKAGEALREYLNVADAVAALRLLAADAGATGNESYRTPEGKLARVAFNVAGGARLSAANLIELTRMILHDDFGITSPEPVLQEGAVGVFEPGSQFNTTQKIKSLFSRYGQAYNPRSLVEGIRETVPWYITTLRQAA